MSRLILHVDDDPNLPEGAEAALAAEGFRRVRTTDPEQVMRAVEREEPDLVLMDLDLSGCDGLDLLAGIAAAREGSVPVLVVTRHACDSAMHGEVIALGVTGFLTRPVAAGPLLESIRELARPAPASQPAAQATDPGKTLPSGSLAERPVPELLAQLRRRAASGVLRLASGDTKVEVELRNGTPFCVASSQARNPTALRSSDAAEEILFETFGWADGSWQLSSSRRIAPGAGRELARDPVGLLLAGVLAACSRARVRQRLKRRAMLYVSVSQDGDDSFRELDLTPKQCAVLADLSGQDSLGDLLASMEFDERLLYALWVTGRIELHTVPTLDLTELPTQPVLARAEALPAPPPAAKPRPAAGPRSRSKAPERRAPPRTIRRDRPTSPTERIRVAPRAATQPSPVSEPVVSPAASPPRSREDLSRILRELSDRIMAGDDFEVLGVEVDATDDELQAAYHQRLHDVPDEAFEATDMGLQVRAQRLRDRVEAAYAHLKDPESRHAYTLLRQEECEERAAGRVAERALEGERWFRKGKRLLQDEKHERAAEAFGMAAHLDPGQGDYLAHLGYALFLANPRNKIVQREAIEHVANGIKRSPSRDLPHVFLGRILRARGDEQAARKLFRRALKLNPESHAARQELNGGGGRSASDGEFDKGILSRLLRR